METDEVISQADDLKEEIDGLPPFQFIPKRSPLLDEKIEKTSKVTEALKSKGGFYRLTSRGAQLSFDEPCFVTVLKIIATEKKIKAFGVSLDGADVFIRLQVDADGVLSGGVDRVIGAIRLEVEDGFLGKGSAAISGIEIFCWPLSDFDSVAEKLKEAKGVDSSLSSKWAKVSSDINAKIIQLREEARQSNDLVESNTQLVEEIKVSIVELNEEKDGLNDKVFNLKKDFDELSQKKTKFESDVGNLVIKQTSLETDISSKQSELRALSETISANSVRLAELKGSINLFPDELVGFSARAEKSRREYMLLSAIPLLIFVYFSWLFASSSADLVVHNVSGGLDAVLGFLLQRVPFVLIVATFIGGAFAFLTHVLKRVEEIHQQELNLSKISIVARDIANAEFVEEDEDVRRERQLEIKIAMIQHYLASEFTRAEGVINRKSERYSGFFGADILSAIFRRQERGDDA